MSIFPPSNCRVVSFHVERCKEVPTAISLTSHFRLYSTIYLWIFRRICKLLKCIPNLDILCQWLLRKCSVTDSRCFMSCSVLFHILCSFYEFVVCWTNYVVQFVSFPMPRFKICSKSSVYCLLFLLNLFVPVLTLTSIHLLCWISLLYYMFRLSLFVTSFAVFICLLLHLEFSCFCFLTSLTNWTCSQEIYCPIIYLKSSFWLVYITVQDNEFPQFFYFFIIHSQIIQPHFLCTYSHLKQLIQHLMQ